MNITKEQAKIILTAIETLMQICYEDNEELNLAKQIIEAFPEFKERFSDLLKEENS